MVNKKIVVITVAAIMAIGTIVGGTMAAYQASTNTDKTITTSSVDVNLHMDGDKVDAAGNVLFDSSELKNGIIEQKVNAGNSGKKDIYLRVKITKAWYLQDEKVFEVDGEKVENSTIGIRPVNTEDWIIPTDLVDVNSENLYIYYRKIVKAGASTSDFMDAFTILKGVDENTNQYAGLSARIKFDADSVQTTAAQDAILAEWGVTVTLDAEGNITSVSNQ